MILGHHFGAWERKKKGKKMSRNFLACKVEKRKKNGLNRVNWGHFIKYTIKTLRKWIFTILKYLIKI